MKQEIVKQFFDFWCRDDIDGALKLCADDVIWDNVPMEPIEGRKNVRDFLARYGAGMSEKQYDILNVMESGELVFIEALENYVRSGSAVSVRFMSAFDVKDNLITHWRDYFDLATVERQLASK